MNLRDAYEILVREKIVVPAYDDLDATAKIFQFTASNKTLFCDYCGKSHNEECPARTRQELAVEKELRDRFAVAALRAVDVQAHVARPAAIHIARSAYEIADAMLIARAK